MKYIFSACLLLLLLACHRERSERRLLVYISSGGATRIGNLLATAKDNNLRVDTTSNGAYLHEDSLPRYSAVVLWYADVNKVGSPQQADLQRYVQAGGGLVSVGSPISSTYQWPWYYQLTHQEKEGLKEGEVAVRKVSTAAATAQNAPPAFAYDGGRVFVLSGDTTGAVPAPATLKEGLVYAVGDNKETDYDKARSPRVPEENRFVKVPLAGDFDEPMQIEIAKDGRVFVIERKGALKLYNPETKSVRVIARLNVFSLLEDGLLGMALDPEFERNGWTYFFYSPAGDVPKQHVSRFTMKGDSLLMNTEKVLLEIPVQRQTCCHSGGGLEFGPDGLLYISAGDNTSSKESSGYTPLDERPGRAPFDSQKSSANTNDLRGKILRIRPEPDGTYSIPVGNLFHKSEPNTRPEIYAMGCRNPFRFTVDKRGWVYWGDVGPDSGVDSLRGPQSYDEFNQARESGYFGWPYFVANNKAYPDYDFATNTIIKEYQNPLKPVNHSPNNTGKKELPPTQKPMIWYPYGPSEEFPMLGTGSRSACAGPFYYSADYKRAPYKFPAYYNDRMFIYEWARGWIKTVAFDRDGNMTKIEDFLPGTPFSKPIDLKFGPDGALYVLDYGKDYFSKNEDALLSRIEYTEGNRAPLPRIAADQTVGAAPLTVHLSAKGSTDYDKADSLKYEWDLPNGIKATSSNGEATCTFTKPGVYKVTLKVTDPQGESATAVQEIKVGNAKPQVQVALAGNQTFFWDNGNIDYQVRVTDKEDGALGSGIDPGKVDVYFDYLQQGRDLALVMDGQYETGSAKYLVGKQLIDASDCRSCHANDKESVGPAYKAVAARYKGNYQALLFLPQKIIKGGNGNWGERLMSAHPQLTTDQATEMVKYILSLANEVEKRPVQGRIPTQQHVGTGEEGRYFFTVSYTDKGANGIGPITAREVVSLRHPKLEADECDAFNKVGKSRPNAGALAFAGGARDGGHIMFKGIDLTGVESLTYRVAAREHDGTIELHLDRPDGPVVNTVQVKPTFRKQGGVWELQPENWTEVTGRLSAASGKHDLYFVFKNDQIKDKGLMNVDWILFRPGGKAMAAR